MDLMYLRSDPLYGTLVRLLAFDLLSIQQHPHVPGVFLRRGRPVKKVELVGVVVSMQLKESYLHFKLDDGTGCVPCIFWTNQLKSAYFSHLKESERQLQAAVTRVQVEQVKLGHLLRVQGRLSCYRESLQITVSSLVKEDDPNAEVFHWVQAVQLALRCYDFPASSQIVHEKRGNSSVDMDVDA